MRHVANHVSIAVARFEEALTLRPRSWPGGPRARGCSSTRNVEQTSGHCSRATTSHGVDLVERVTDTDSLDADDAWALFVLSGLYGQLGGSADPSRARSVAWSGGRSAISQLRTGSSTAWTCLSLSLDTVARVLSSGRGHDTTSSQPWLRSRRSRPSSHCTGHLGAQRGSTSPAGDT